MARPSWSRVLGLPALNDRLGKTLGGGSRLEAIICGLKPACAHDGRRGGPGITTRGCSVPCADVRQSPQNPEQVLKEWGLTIQCTYERGNCNHIGKIQNYCTICKLTRLCIRHTEPLDVYRRISALPCLLMVRRAGYLWQCPGAGWQNTQKPHYKSNHTCILTGTHGHDLPRKISSIRILPAIPWPTDLMQHMRG